MNETERFLAHIFAGVRGFFEVTLIHPQRARGKNILTRFYELGVDTPDWDRIAALNDEGWGCYYGTSVTAQPPRYGRRKEADVTALSCLWCEFDFKDGVYATVDDVIQASGDFVPPTALVFSGGGLHCLYRIAPVAVTPHNRAAIKETIRGMALAMKADTAATDLARVLRLPGTRNTKPGRGGAMCELIDLIDGEYTLDTFDEYREFAQPVRRAIKRSLPRHRPDDLPPKVQEYLDMTIPQGQRNAALNLAAWVLHTEGFSRADADHLLMGKALADGLPDREVERTITSAFAAPPGVPSYLSKRAVSRIRAAEATTRNKTA